MSAVISPCGTYRYELSRRVNLLVNFMGVFMMLNPSTADASDDDPTIRRCIGFTKAWGWSHFTVFNLFALRATDPSELSRHPDPIGPNNDSYLQNIPREWPIVAAWGAHPFAVERASEVVKLLNRPLYCLGQTKSGAPRHPLYLPKTAQPVIWHKSEIGAPPWDARPRVIP
jgi:hypothetical protein